MFLKNMKRQWLLRFKWGYPYTVFFNTETLYTVHININSKHLMCLICSYFCIFVRTDNENLLLLFEESALSYMLSLKMENMVCYILFLMAQLSFLTLVFHVSLYLLVQFCIQRTTGTVYILFAN
jgi:hypothetical protein